MVAPQWLVVGEVEKYKKRCRGSLKRQKILLHGDVRTTTTIEESHTFGTESRFFDD